jgi:MFS family permease
MTERTTPDPPKRPNKSRQLSEFLGLRPNILVLLTMVVLVGLGERMAERFLPLYLIALGGGALSVGLLNGMDNLLSALYSFPGGYLSDRLGYKRALIVFNLIAMAGYAVVILFPFWQAVILGAVLFISWSAISLPATMDLVSEVLPLSKRTMGVSMHSLVRRIPMGLGPVMGGALIGLYGEQDGVRIAFGAALVLSLLSVVLQQRFLTDERKQVREAEGNPLRALAQIRPSLRRLLISDILVRFCEQIPYAFVVIWAVNINGISALQFGILTSIEMATAMLIYIPVAYLADRNTKKPFVVMTFGFFTLFPLVLLFSRSFPAMVVAFVIRGMKEFGEPTRKALIMDLAPEGRKAGTFGVYYLVRDVIVSLAAFGGALLWDARAAATLFDTFGFGHRLLPFIESVASPTTNLLIAFLFGLAGTAYFLIFGRDLKSETGQTGPATA